MTTIAMKPDTKAAPAASTATKAKLAVAYLRVSTDKQPLSIADQRHAVQDWADKHGVKIIRWYEDEAKSGASAHNRMQFQRMIAETEARKDVGHVLCYDVSRFGRTDTDEAGFYRYRLRQAGTEVVYVAETAVNGSETDDLLLPVLQYQKREYLRSLSRDTLRGLTGLAARGAWCGGPAPFGCARELRSRDGTPVRVLARGERAVTEDGSAIFLVPGDPRDVEAIRLAWEMYWVQKTGVDAVRDHFMASGIKPPRGPAWRSTSIRAMLLNPVYTGRSSYGIRTDAKFFRVTKEGTIARPRAASGVFELDPFIEGITIEGANPVLVSPAAAMAFRMWEKADRERRQQRQPWKRKNRWESQSPYLLSSLMRCARCGYKFCGATRRRKGHVYRDYLCCGNQASGPKFCARFAVNQDRLEDFVIEKVRERWGLLLGADAVRARVEAEIERVLAPTSDDEVARVRKEIAAVGEKMVAVVQKLASTHADIANAALDRLKAERKPLEERLHQLENAGDAKERLAAASCVLARLIVRLNDVLKTGSLADRRAVLRAFVQGIFVHPAEGAVDVVLWSIPKMDQAPTGSLSLEEPVPVELVAGVRFSVYARLYHRTWGYSTPCNPRPAPSSPSAASTLRHGGLREPHRSPSVQSRKSHNSLRRRCFRRQLQGRPLKRSSMIWRRIP